jgi:hypothetical protein
MRVPEALLVHLRHARDLADRHYADPLDVADFAATAGVSKYHFIRCFAPPTARHPRSTSRSDESNAPKTFCERPT